jgi:hypothetical protein
MGVESEDILNILPLVVIPINRPICTDLSVNSELFTQKLHTTHTAKIQSQNGSS